MLVRERLGGACERWENFKSISFSSKRRVSLGNPILQTIHFDSAIHSEFKLLVILGYISAASPLASLLCSTSFSRPWGDILQIKWSRKGFRSNFYLSANVVCVVALECSAALHTKAAAQKEAIKYFSIYHASVASGKYIEHLQFLACFFVGERECGVELPTWLFLLIIQNPVDRHETKREDSLHPLLDYCFHIKMFLLSFDDIVFYL